MSAAILEKCCHNSTFRAQKSSSTTHVTPTNDKCKNSSSKPTKASLGTILSALFLLLLPVELKPIISKLEIQDKQVLQLKLSVLKNKSLRKRKAFYRKVVCALPNEKVFFLQITSLHYEFTFV